MTVSVLGIRHHGPGSARSVQRELDRITPEIVLIEGPADADPLLGLVAEPGMDPPVALLAYNTDTPRVSAFWPFAAFSPEWQALQWAAAHDVPVRFCDLPSSQVLAAEREDRSGLRGDPIGALAEAAGYDDAERWWDDVIESRMDGRPPFEAIAEAMTELRTDPQTMQEQRREAQMRQVLRAALKQTHGTVAVVCGAWHAPALSGRLPSAASDAALLRGAPKCRTTLAWVPWTHSRLATSSGYGAGVTSPGWYHHLFTTPDQPVTRWLTAVAGVLRAHDLPVSTAHVIEAVRLADTLASMRGRPLAGLSELSEATKAVMCDGDDLALAFVTSDLVVGERLGAVPDSAPLVPLDRDLQARAKTLRLTLDPLERTITLDLRRAADRGTSILLHQLTALGVDWGRPAADQARHTGTFHETWSLQWRPELAVAVVDAALWGTTVGGAASARVVSDARAAEALDAVTRAVELVLLADLSDALPDVLTALDAKAALDVDVEHLMAAVPALVRAVRYGDVRGTDTAALAVVVDALTVRICAGLPAAVTNLADDAAALLRVRVDELHAALALRAQDDTAPRERWLTALAQVAGRRDVHGLLGGRITRLLLDAGVLAKDEAARRFGAHLSIGATAADKAAWAEGFLSGSGLPLVHDRDLLAVLDTWVSGLGEQDFLDVLPLLRRTFGDYSRSERSHIGESVRHLDGPRPVARADEPVDAARADGVLRTVALILGGRR